MGMALWVLHKEALKDRDSALEDGCVIRERIRIRTHGLKAALYWNAAAFGNCCTYSIYHEGSVIHRSYVIHRCFKFPFLKRNDIEIGPCRTEEDWRGRNIYPFVLKWIAAGELEEQGRAFLIISEKNKSSMAGARKAGFQKMCGVRKGFFHIYRISG